MKAVPANAHALSAFRVLTDDMARVYTATTFPRDPYAGCERFIRTGFAAGWLADTGTMEDTYAVLDVFDAQGDIIEDYVILSATAFKQIKKRLGLVVVDLEAG